MAKWKRSPLGAVADLCLGKMLDQNKNRGEPLPYLANVNVRWGEFALDDLRTMRFEAHEMERYGLKFGDIVMCEGGEPGRCAIWKEQVPGMMIQKALHRIRPRDLLDYRFLYYNLLHIGHYKGFDQYFTGATIKHLPGENLAKVEVDLPPLPIQQHIAGILSAYDELIENSQRRIKILEAMARALYREWFVHFRFPGHEHHPRVASPLGEIPMGWEVKKLSDLFEFIGGAQPPKSQHIHQERPGYVRFVQNRDYGSSSHLTYIAESRRNKICDRMDIMVDKYGEPGRTRYGLAGAYNVALAKLLPHEAHQREWLRGLISEPDFNTYLAGASMAATRASLNSSHFTLEVAVPTEEISRAFQRHIEPILKLVLTHRDKIQNLRRTRDLLLPRLLSGQVEVEEA